MPDLGSASLTQADSSNTPAGSASPNTIDDNIRETKGALVREWNWRSYTLSAGGTADAKTLTYSVAPAAYYNGQRFSFIANTTNTGTATLNVNSLGAKTIKKVVNGVLTALAASDMVSGAFVEVAYNAADDSMVWVNYAAPPVTPSASTTVQGIVELATATEVLTGTDTDRAVTPDGLAALWEQGSDIASASTISVGEGSYFTVTGTTTITDIDPATDRAGREFELRFAGVLTLTHNATTLILPGGANITTAAGDVARFRSEGSDNVRCVSYTRASGLPVVAPAGGAVVLGTISTASGSSASLGSLVLTDYRVIELWLLGVSINVSNTDFLLGNSTSDDVVVVDGLSSASNTWRGIISIDLADGQGVSTVFESNGTYRGRTFDTALSTATTTISVAPDGSNNFDAGSIRVVGYR
jgi:hypothetical protein